MPFSPTNLGKSRVTAVTQSATPAINTDNIDTAVILNIAQAITSMTSSLTGTPVDGQVLWIEFLDNGTARAITWGASFESTVLATLPSTTVASVRLRVRLKYSTASSKWGATVIE